MKKYPIVFIIFYFLFLSSCNNDKKEAQQLLDQAKTFCESSDFGSAKLTLDSLKKRYPKEVEIQKENLQLMRFVDLKEQERNILYCDSMLVVRQLQADSLKPLFIFEKDKEYDEIGKYIDKQQSIERNVQRSYIRSGVNERGEMYLASVYYGSGPIHHTQLKVSKSNGEYTETASIPQDGGLNYTFTDLGMTTEVVTYQNGKDSSVISFIYNNKDLPLKAEYIGKKNYSFTIAPGDKKSLAKTFELALVLYDLERLKKEKEKSLQRIEYLQSKLEQPAVK